MDNNTILKDAVVRAFIIRETLPIGQKFDAETLGFLQDFFLWRRPEKFVFEDDGDSFVSGEVYLYHGRHRIFKFVFKSGHVWLASLRKASRKEYKEYCTEASLRIDKFYMDNDVLIPARVVSCH